MKVEYFNNRSLPFALSPQQILYVSEQIIPLYEDFFEKIAKEKKLKCQLAEIGSYLKKHNTRF